MRNWMRRHADPDAVLSSADEIVRERRALEHERERAGPEFLRELRCGLRHFARPSKGARTRIEVHDHRMVGRASLHRIEFFYGRRIRGIGAQPVHGFRRKCDEAAFSQNANCSPNIVSHCRL